MGKQDVNEYDKSYHPPETIKLDYCAAVLAVVLEHHPAGLGPGYVFAPWIPACTGTTSTSIIRKDIYETLH